MFVVLVRHGEAVDDIVDSRRPLSERGRAEAKALASILATAVPRPVYIMHSSKERSKQTAEILANALGADLGLEPALEPGADYHDLVQLVTALTGNTDSTGGQAKDKLQSSKRYKTVILVGHLPNLHKALTEINRCAADIEFHTCTAVGIQQNKIKLLITPHI